MGAAYLQISAQYRNKKTKHAGSKPAAPDTAELRAKRKAERQAKKKGRK